jgi:acyl-coenzyme A thioesterase PaaI-like protein
MSFISRLINKLPEKFRNNTMITLFGLTKVPTIFFVGPKVLELSDTSCKVKIPLNWRTKNHLNSIYFGVMAVGADVTCGLAAMRMIMDSGKNVSLSFKDFKAEFLKRAEGDTIFVCNQNKEIKALVESVLKSGERENLSLNIVATTPSKLGDEPVATFNMTLSLKLKR